MDTHHSVYDVHCYLYLFMACFIFKAVTDYGNQNAGVFVMSTEDYLTNFYPTVQTALDLYYSLAAVNAELNELGMLSFIVGFKVNRKLLIKLFYSVRTLL